MIAAFLGDAAHAGAVLRASGAVRPEAIGLGARRVLDRHRGRRMIEMRVRDQDMRDGLAAQRAEQRRDMRSELRPRVDHGDLAMSDDVGARALEGERAGVARDDAADERRQRRGDAVINVDVAAKGDLGGHVA